jgi:streptogramin lyase
LVEGPSAEVREYDVEGELRRIFRADIPGRPVTDSIMDAWIEHQFTRGQSSRSAWRERYESMPLPDTLPAFSALLVDDLERVWAGVYEPNRDPPHRWVVFDREGRAPGTVETPAGLDVQAVTKDAVVGVWTDELGVQEVRVHRLVGSDRPTDSPPAG